MPPHSDAIKAAIKNAIDIVALAGETLQLRRMGSKYKALCPFHDDHNPSLEVNPERQSFKCWSCGAGGDVFDFVMNRDHVDFPEALRMLADRAGIELERPPAAAGRGPSASGASKSDLLEVQSWARDLFVKALAKSEEATGYLRDRGLSPEMAERFWLGYAPAEKGWLAAEARRRGYPPRLLEEAGLVSLPEDSPGAVRERFRGRLIFPIQDERGRTVGFGGRILPAVERGFVAQGKHVAKYLNSPETALFQKRKLLYAADLARAASRESGWVAVVEGYTDVIAAHQVGVCNVVGTLGTALGEGHVQGLRRLSDRVVLIFDGDAAGQSAADRALDIFLGHELDVRVLSLPENLDPCDFLLKEGAGPFRGLVERAGDPLAFLLERAGARFDLGSIEGGRRAAESILEVLSKIPAGKVAGVDLKLEKFLDTLGRTLRMDVAALRKRLQGLRKAATARAARASRPAPAAPPTPAASPADAEAPGPAEAADRGPIDPRGFDPIDRELIEIILNEPGSVRLLASRVTAQSLRDEPLREILKAAFGLLAEGAEPTCEQVMLRLDDPRLRSLAAAMTLSMESAPLPDDVRPAPWRDRLKGLLDTITRRERQSRIRDLGLALDETDEKADPEAYRALRLEYLRLMFQRPDTKKDAS
ncbi:DNA primase [Aquisphaera giovannonii]|uniref:DNA primase n=1 Tax=Aquisphaera giovannonii TaxID=406548 RepID=A0A5B9VYG9_9BACT|nr:DNA primase [Aquisphaera giovannonii]QEH33024.1 DNA primase [Aquisphaera giovannonii]